MTLPFYYLSHPPLDLSEPASNLPQTRAHGFPGFPEPSSREPVTIAPSGHEEWEVEKLLKDSIYQKKREFLINWKGYDEIEATWEPLDVLERASTPLRTYWFDTYNETMPLHLLWTHNECWSAWTVQTPEFIYLSPELDPAGLLTPIQVSDYSETEAYYTVPSHDESQLETQLKPSMYYSLFC